MKRYSDFISGENDQYAYAAAEKLLQLSINNVTFHHNTFTKDMLSMLENIYPEKYELSGQESIKELIDTGIKKAQSPYQFRHCNHIALIIILMFFFGHDFDHDPFYNWASMEQTSKYIDGTLVEDNSEVLANKLEKRAKIWLVATIKNEEQMQNNRNNQI